MPETPLLPGFYSDPSICRSELGYFLVTSSFEYFPGVPLFHSSDLIEWRQVGHVLDRPSQLDLEGAYISAGIYAPTIRCHKGRFYMITTVENAGRRSGNFYVSTDDPFGDWSDPVWIEGMNGIDPDLFWDNDGTAYVNWSLKQKGNPHIRIGQAAIDLQSGRLTESPRDLWDGTGGLGPEGPHIYRIGEWYYLYIAEGGTEYGHMQVIARSRHVRGPWESCPRNPVLTHRSSASAVHAVGHGDLVQTPGGDWYGVAHGIRPRGYHRFHVLGRETFLYPLTWDSAGWPVIGDNGMLPTETVEIGGRPVQPDPVDFRDDFKEECPPLQWNYLRNPVVENYIRKGNGKLVLKGAPDRISGTGRPTWLGVRQRAHQCVASARVEAVFSGDDAEAGLTAFQNLRGHACVGLRRKGTQTRFFTRIRLGDIDVEKPGPAMPDGPIRLTIQAEDLCYRLGYTDTSGGFHELDRIEARFLSTEVIGQFTGVYFALYAGGSAELYCHEFEVRE